MPIIIGLIILPMFAFAFCRWLAPERLLMQLLAAGFAGSAGLSFIFSAIAAFSSQGSSLRIWFTGFVFGFPLGLILGLVCWFFIWLFKRLRS